MNLIVITPEQNIYKEEDFVNQMFQLGLQKLHIRKPFFSLEQMVNYLKKIDPKYYDRIVLHDYFSLVSQFGLCGVHLNKRNPAPPYGADIISTDPFPSFTSYKVNYCSSAIYSGSISRSCHSISEVRAFKGECNYVFLSPIFNSISKVGYTSKFSEQELIKAQESGVIDNKVYALGGVSSSNINVVKHLGFGGAVMLGSVWNQKEDDIIPHFKDLLCSCNQL